VPITCVTAAIELIQNHPVRQNSLLLENSARCGIFPKESSVWPRVGNWDPVLSSSLASSRAPHVILWLQFLCLQVETPLTGTIIPCSAVCICSVRLFVSPDGDCNADVSITECFTSRKREALGDCRRGFCDEVRTPPPLVPSYPLEEESVGRWCLPRGIGLQWVEQWLGFECLIILIAQLVHSSAQNCLQHPTSEVLVNVFTVHPTTLWKYCFFRALLVWNVVMLMLSCSSRVIWDGCEFYSSLRHSLARRGSASEGSPGACARGPGKHVRKLVGLSRRINTCVSIGRIEPESWQL